MSMGSLYNRITEKTIDRGMDMSLKRFDEIAETLEKQIRIGVFPHGAKLPSQQELCLHFGVSRPVIQKVFNILGERGLIERQPGRGVYAIFPGAELRTLRNVAVVIPTDQWRDLKLDDNYGLEFFRGVESALTEENLGIQLIAVEPGKPESLRKQLSQVKVDGIISSFSFSDLIYLEKMNVLGIPVVIGGANPDVPGVSCVAPDWYHAVRQFLRSVWRRGYRRVAVFSAGKHVSHPQVSEAVLTIRQELPRLQLKQIDYMGGRPFQCELRPWLNECLVSLAREGLPEILIFSDDWTALRALELLQKIGIRVPDQVEVTGFLGLGLAYSSSPKLTTFRIDAEEMGRRCVKVLKATLNNSSVPIVDSISAVYDEQETFRFCKYR